MSSQCLCSLYPKNSGSTLAEYRRMPTVPPRLTLFFILRRNDPPTAVAPFLIFLTPGRVAGTKKCGSLESGSLESGSLESGSLENGSLENGSLEPPKRYAKKISCGRRLLVEPQGCGGENKKMWIIREWIIREWIIRTPKKVC